MPTETIAMTQEGYNKLIAELDELKSVRRLEVAEQLKEARSYGDLSENAEYDAAKKAQADLEERIGRLEQMVRLAKVIDESEISSDIVNLGHTVRIQNTETGEEAEYRIVSSNESDPFEGLISNESPIGRGLIGARKDHVVEIEIPDGIRHFKVLEISR